MSLPSLAEVSDVQDRMFRELTESEINRVEFMLKDASAVIRNYTKQAFTASRATQRLRPVGYRIRLPRRPVAAVHSVGLIINMSLLNMVGWTWDGANEIWLADMGIVINLPESASEWLANHTPVAEVDYTAGYTDVPSDVVGVACSMIARNLSAPAGGGIISQAVGEYTYRLSDAAAQGPLTLTDSEKEILSVYRPNGTVVELRW